MTGEIDRAIDEDRQLGVDLDQAVEPALVPVVAAPGLPGDVFQLELLARGKRQMRDRARAALGDRGLEHDVKLVARNNHPLTKRLDAIRQSARSRYQGLEASRGPARNVPRRRSAQPRRRARVIRRRSRGAHPAACECARPPRGLAPAGSRTANASSPHRPASPKPRRVEGGQLAGKAIGFLPEVRQRSLARGRRSGLPFRRSVVRVHECVVVLADGQHQFHVAIRKGIHVGHTWRRR